LQKGLQFSEERHKGDVDITQLRYYLAVTELGSFSKAATRCHVSQPALSVQMQKLEVRMGKLLLNRNHRRIVPTEAGLILVRRAKEILAQVEDTKCEIRNSGGIHAGKVSFGVLPTIAPYFLAHVLDSFITQYPKAQVFIHENITDQLLQRIESGKLDFGIVSRPIREYGFETEELFSEELLLALPPRHPLSKKRMIFADDLHSEKFILLQEDHCLGDQGMAFCNKPDFHPRIVIRSGQLATVQSLVAAGMGISLIPQMAIGEKPAHITYRQLEDPRPKRSIAVVTRSKRHQKVAAQEFLKHLRLVGKTFGRTA
jgi:LysR family hydrogen peroxide-inducible transcriptional activator